MVSSSHPPITRTLVLVSPLCFLPPQLLASYSRPIHTISSPLNHIPYSPQINSIVGSAKELVGNTIEAGYQAVGGSSESSSFTTAGQKQHAQGEAEIKAAEAKGYVEG